MGKTDKEVPYTKVPNYIIRDEGISVIEFRVYCAILSCNPSFPSVPTIEQWTGISQRRVFSALRILEKKKYIKVLRSPGVNNRYQPLHVVHGSKVKPLHNMQGTPARGARVTPARGAGEKEQSKNNKKKAGPFGLSGEGGNWAKRPPKDIVDLLRGKVKSMPKGGPEK